MPWAAISSSSGSSCPLSGYEGQQPMDDTPRRPPAATSRSYSPLPSMARSTARAYCSSDNAPASRRAWSFAISSATDPAAGDGGGRSSEAGAELSAANAALSSASTRCSIRSPVRAPSWPTDALSHPGSLMAGAGAVGERRLDRAGHSRRGDVVDLQLVQWLRPLDVAQNLVADRSHPHAVWKVAGHDRARCLRQQHLPAAPNGGDARRPYDVEPGISLVADGRLAGVQAEPHTDRYALRPRLVLVRALDLDGRRHRVAGARKRVEEGVALRVDLLAVVRPERLAHDAPMGRQASRRIERRRGA